MVVSWLDKCNFLKRKNNQVESVYILLLIVEGTAVKRLPTGQPSGGHMPSLMPWATPAVHGTIVTMPCGHAAVLPCLLDM